MARSQWLIMKDGAACRCFIVGDPLSQHRVADATSMQKLVDLAETSELQRPPAPVAQEAGSRMGNHLDQIIPAAIRDDARLDGL